VPHSESEYLDIHYCVLFMKPRHMEAESVFVLRLNNEIFGRWLEFYLLKHGNCTFGKDRNENRDALKAPFEFTCRSIAPTTLVHVRMSLSFRSRGTPYQI
jgi:hypothetical protein